MTIRTLLIANRGEIAVRVIRAAKALGMRTVQVYSQADTNSLAVRLADEAIEIGPPAARKSYLDIDAVLNAAKAAKADAVHPGYGFLSENADFADAVVAAGMKFVGPSGDAIRLLGDKVAARRVAAEAGVPTVPGSDGRVDNTDVAREIVTRIGFPVM
ncbi:MAG: acetyl-CoA carboxylase biotin carboxylase subunit, partial [Rhizobiaceae bacterium]